MCGGVWIKLLSALLHRQEQEAPGVTATGSFGASTVRSQLIPGVTNKEYCEGVLGNSLLHLYALLQGQILIQVLTYETEGNFDFFLQSVLN